MKLTRDDYLAIASEIECGGNSVEYEKDGEEIEVDIDSDSLESLVV